jgi:D-glycero-D-manno-heptose 1,7-bisphosphate phosphatase
MMLQAALDLGLDLGRSWCVGDKPSDLAAGRVAGVGPLVLYDPAAPMPERRGDHWAVPRLGDVTALLAAEAG